LSERRERVVEWGVSAPSCEEPPEDALYWLDREEAGREHLGPRTERRHDFGVGIDEGDRLIERLRRRDFELRPRDVRLEIVVAHEHGEKKRDLFHRQAGGLVDPHAAAALRVDVASVRQED